MKQSLLLPPIFFLSLLVHSKPCIAQKELEIHHLEGDFYVYTTYNYYQNTRIPANGMYLVTNAGAVIIDSPWDSTQFQPLLDSISKKHGKKAVMCIATHFHEDRTGGLEYFSSQGIKTYTTKLTDEWSSKKGMKRAQYLLEKDTSFTIGQYIFKVLYPGPGHSPDNIVIWFEKEKILYGGCLVKSTDNKDLGNLGDANILEYASTMERVMRNCQGVRHVIPGHNSWTSTRSLKHTLNLARKLRKAKP